jgi:hypothetical protein
MQKKLTEYQKKTKSTSNRRSLSNKKTLNLNMHEKKAIEQIQKSD